MDYGLSYKLFILLCYSFLSCNKERTVLPATIVNVKFRGDEDYIGMETINGEWSSISATLKITASAYNLSNFYLYLPAVADTGNYANPTIDNIYFSDGLDFQPVKLTEGYIHIAQVNMSSISGDFEVILLDYYNGVDEKAIVGNFKVCN